MLFLRGCENAAWEGLPARALTACNPGGLAQRGHGSGNGRRIARHGGGDRGPATRNDSRGTAGAKYPRGAPGTDTHRSRLTSRSCRDYGLLQALADYGPKPPDQESGSHVVVLLQE